MNSPTCWKSRCKMVSCRTTRAIVPLTVDGEVGPEESFRLARHLPECTACRILLARERRLAAMLDAFEDGLLVDARFTEQVMSALPQEPLRAPAGHLAKLKRRGLKLAGFAGLIGLGLGLLSRSGGLGIGSGTLPGLPRLTFEGMDSMLEALTGLVRLAVLALARVGSGIQFEIPFLSGAAGLGHAALPPLFLALLMLSMALAFATRSYARGLASPRAFIRFLSTAGVIPRRFAVADRPHRSSVSARRT